MPCICVVSPWMFVYPLFLFFSLNWYYWAKILFCGWIPTILGSSSVWKLVKLTDDVTQREQKSQETILYFPIPHNALCLPPKFCIKYCCECSWEYADLPRVFYNNSLCKIWGANRVHYGQLENSELNNNQTPERANKTKKKCHRFLHRGKPQFCSYLSWDCNCCLTNTLQIDFSSNKGAKNVCFSVERLGVRKAVVANPRRDTCSREVFRHEVIFFSFLLKKAK